MTADEEAPVEGEQDDSDIKITAPKAPEVNPEVYENTVLLIQRGFLTAFAELNGIPFVFKSLNHNEFDLIRLMTGLSPSSQAVPPRFWDVFLAHMVLFVDGHNVLAERSKYLSLIADTFREIPHSARVRLIRQLSDLNRKTSQATMLVEAYATESYSRWRWAQVYGMDLSSPATTGVAGTETVGLCYAQLLWRAINRYEDLRDQNESEWENAKFISGSMAGKGIQKVYNRDNERRRKEREERWNKKDQLIRHVLFGEPLEGDKRYGGAQVVMVASTVEELAEQVEKSLRGEKDWHDQIVQEYEDGIRNGVRAKAQHIQSLAKAHQEEMGGKPVTSNTSLSGLTPEQVNRLIEAQRQREWERAERGESAQLLDENVNTSLSKWGLLDGSLPTTDQPTDRAFPLQPGRNAGKPWRP